jgi:YihY family inner membrane protein
MSIGRIVERVRALPVARQVLLVQARYGKEHAGYYADALTYQAFFAIFPALLVASAVLGFVLQDPATRAEVIGAIASAVPGLRTIAGDLIESLVDARAVTGIIGSVALAWRGIAVVRSASTALGAIHRREDTESFWKSIARAAVSSLALGGFAIAGVGLGIAAGVLPESVLVAGILLVLSIAIDFGLFLLAYRILVPGGGPAFRRLIPGAAFAAIGWGVLKIAAAALAQRSLDNATAVYGSFAVAIALLATMSFAARIFMYGAIINALHREDAFRALEGVKRSSRSVRSVRA